MGLRRRPNPDVYDDPDYDWQRHDPEVADDVADMLLAPDNYAATNTGPDAAQRDELRHQEAVFLHGLREALTEQLRGQNIRCVRATPDGHGEGYHIVCRDKEGRQYEAHMGFDDAFEKHALYGDKTGRAIVQDLCGKILAARERWFARMAISRIA